MTLLAFASFLTTFAAVALAIPSFIFTVECLLAQLPRVRREAKPSTARYVVVVPAHDEALGIGETLELLDEAVDETRGEILVVADNCTDRTADIARAHGARVLERTDHERRGKGYALAHAVAALAADPPDVLVFVDADCAVDRESIRRLVDVAVATEGPAQADYVLTPASDAPRAMIGALAFLVRNRVRPLGLARIGGPCGLFGTGMAVPYALFASLPNAESHLVEDMWLGVASALAGHAPTFVPDARVTSRGVASDEAARAQSTRWEHGHLEVLRTHVPRLLAGDYPSAVALGLDLAVPPLALLVALHLAALVPAVILALVDPPSLGMEILLESLAWITFAVFVSWARFGRDTIPFRALLGIPKYVLLKLPVYVRYLRDKQTRWVRTERE